MSRKITLGGLCPPSGDPLGFASRTFGPPGRQIRKERIFAPQKWERILFPNYHSAPQKFILAPAKPLLRIKMEGLRPSKPPEVCCFPYSI